MGDHADDAQRIEEQEEFDRSDALLKNLQEHVKHAYKAYPHLLNKIDIIYRTAILTAESGGNELMACSDAKEAIDELLLENKT